MPSPWTDWPPWCCELLTSVTKDEAGDFDFFGGSSSSELSNVKSITSCFKVSFFGAGWESEWNIFISNYYELLPPIRKDDSVPLPLLVLLLLIILQLLLLLLLPLDRIILFVVANLWTTGELITWASFLGWSGLQEPSSWNWISVQSVVAVKISLNNLLRQS